MLEAYGDIWDNIQNYQAVVITTNGFVKKNGEAVMGRGIALEAKNRYPLLPLLLGSHIKLRGNTVGWFRELFEPIIITFPVKPIFGPNGQPGWKAKADLKLIEESAKELARLTSVDSYTKILMPRPGCGNGGLKWEEVKPIIEPILDDRFTVMHNPAFV